MNRSLASIVTVLFLFASLAAALGRFHGQVTKLGDPASFASVRVQLGEFDETYGCSAQGYYSTDPPVPDQETYYMYAWKYYGDEKWTDSKYEYLPSGGYKEVNFALHRGEDPWK